MERQLLVILHTLEQHSSYENTSGGLPCGLAENKRIAF
jgi:hypothetical protein